MNARCVLILIVMAGLCSGVCDGASNTVVRVLLMAGQSNMGGTLNGADLLEGMASVASNVWFDNATPGGANNSTNWSMLSTATGFGPEMGASYVVARAVTNEQIAVVKDSQAGSGLTYWSTPGQAGYISLTDRIALARARLNAQQAAGEISNWYWGGFFWMQGEAEANATVAYPSEQYFQNLTDLFQKVRLLTGVTNLPMIVGRTHIGITVNVPQYLHNVRSNQVRGVSVDTRAAWVDCDDVGLQDKFHLDSLGSLKLGLRMGVSYLGLVETNPCITINQAAGQADPTPQRTVQFTLRSNRPLDGIEDGNIALGGSARPATALVWRASAFNGAYEEYGVAVSGMSNDGSVTVELRPGAVTSGGFGNFPSVSEDNRVWYSIVRSVTNVLVHDDFNQANRGLGGARQGLGWRNQGWVSATQGYEITNAPALVYSNLMVNTPSGKGGYSFQDAGRTFDTLGALRAYTTPGDLTNIGRSNDEYWVSFLIRRTYNDPVHAHGRVALCRASGSVAWYNDRVAEVYQGGGNWVFQVKGSPQCVITTAVPATVGQTFFMVMRLRLAGNAPSNVVDLYINPWPLGGEPPATPTASLAIVTNNFNLARLVWRPGNQPNYGMLDEFRFGTSYAAVTPVWPENTAPEIVTTNVPQGAVGQPYGAVLQAVGGAGNLTWSVAEGGLPAGLELSPLGVIRGTPSVAGTTNISFAVTDESAQTATQGVTVVVVPEPELVLVALGWLAAARRRG